MLIVVYVDETVALYIIAGIVSSIGRHSNHPHRRQRERGGFIVCTIPSKDEPRRLMKTTVKTESRAPVCGPRREIEISTLPLWVRGGGEVRYNTVRHP
jgi:hypothetical protein